MSERVEREAIFFKKVVSQIRYELCRGLLNSGKTIQEVDKILDRAGHTNWLLFEADDYDLTLRDISDFVLAIDCDIRVDMTHVLQSYEPTHTLELDAEL